MKIITSLFVIVALIVTGISRLYATDRCVAEAGAGGCYPSITDAINASVDGDRIIIAPKAGGVPYVENLNITKSLEFLSDSEQVKFVMQGNITITPAIGRTITFIGMRNTAGNVNATGASPAGTRCKVNIMDCDFDLGYINLNTDNFDVSVVSTILNDGYIAIRFGRVIGNDITSVTSTLDAGSANFTGLYIAADATVTDDTIAVIGNKITMNYTYGWYGYRYGIYAATTSQYLYISNNYIKSSAGSTYTVLSDNGMLLNYAKNSSTGKNTVLNNTIDWSGMVNLFLGINISNTYANSVFEVNNNILLSNNTTTNGITGSSNSGVVSLSYNIMKSPLAIVSFVDNGTNNISSNTTLNGSGVPMPGSDAIDGGAPDQSYYDIDLTRNDAGAYGGSFTLDNYFPMTGATRVFMVMAPRKVVLGNTMNVQAVSFDR